MRLDVYHHFSWDDDGPPWAVELKGLIVEGLQTIMATLDELNAALGTISAEVDKVSADTDKLLADLANIPTGGLTPEQQASIDAAVASATAIADRLKALDDKVPDTTA